MYVAVGNDLCAVSRRGISSLTLVILRHVANVCKPAERPRKRRQFGQVSIVCSHLRARFVLAEAVLLNPSFDPFDAPQQNVDLAALAGSKVGIRASFLQVHTTTQTVI